MAITGHSVRRDAAGNLYKGADTNKDQSYFLYMTRAGQLRHALFPLGEMKKPQVRQIAREAGLPVSEKKDSTGICFIGERRSSSFWVAVSARPTRRHGSGGRRNIGQS